MKILATSLIVGAASLSLLSAQEKPVPKDSTRLSISGCARGRVFTVGRSPEHEWKGVLDEGMKLRLEGQKKLLEEIKARETSMVEITGLMKQSDTKQPGVGLAGGRVRIAPVMPANRGVPGQNMGPTPPVFDVESWRLLNSSCPGR